MRERGSSFGLSVTQGGGGTTVGVNGSRNSASSTTYTPALLSVGGHLSLAVARIPSCAGRLSRRTARV